VRAWVPVLRCAYSLACVSASVVQRRRPCGRTISWGCMFVYEGVSVGVSVGIRAGCAREATSEVMHPYSSFRAGVRTDVRECCCRELDIPREPAAPWPPMKVACIIGVSGIKL